MVVANITMVSVPTKRKAAYLDFSARMAAVYRDHGAISVVDHWQSSESSESSESADAADFHANGASYEPAQLTSVVDAARANAGESIVATVMTWPSRKARDRGIAAATSDPRVLATLDEEPIFDGARVIGDSFEVAMTVPRD